MIKHLSLLGILGGFILYGGLMAQDPPPPVFNHGDDFEVQARGPVHEAYARPYDIKAEPGQPIAKEPPPPVPELPPEERPEGNHIEWISGYWAWDADRNDFLWVSGVYREIPEGRRWIPGYWAQMDQGWIWVPGFWAEAEAQVQYVPEPPASLEVGPSLPGPEDTVYIPGNWVYQETRYAWRPGYWGRPRVGFVWIPAQYLWSPSGYVYVPGYWDYPLERRGLWFAPVYFNRPVWGWDNWFYRPRYVVGTNMVFDFFFARGGSNSYFFGDYFGPRYMNAGYRPWFAGPGRFDPLFGYYRYAYRDNPNWFNRLDASYRDRNAGRLAAPPRTWQQQQLVVNNNIQNNNQINLLASLDQAGRINQNLKLNKVNDQQLQAFRQQAQQTREFSQNRLKLEAANRAVGKGNQSRSVPLQSFLGQKGGAPSAQQPGVFQQPKGPFNKGAFQDPDKGPASKPPFVQQPKGPDNGKPPVTVQPKGPDNLKPPFVQQPKGPDNGKPPITVQPKGPDNVKPPFVQQPKGPDVGKPPTSVQPKGPDNVKPPFFQQPKGPDPGKQGSIFQPKGPDNKKPPVIQPPQINQPVNPPRLNLPDNKPPANFNPPRRDPLPQVKPPEFKPPVNINPQPKRVEPPPVRNIPEQKSFSAPPQIRQAPPQARPSPPQARPSPPEVRPSPPSRPEIRTPPPRPNPPEIRSNPAPKGPSGPPPGKGGPKGKDRGR